jgi:hypothetical protein
MESRKRSRSTYESTRQKKVTIKIVEDDQSEDSDQSVIDPGADALTSIFILKPTALARLVFPPEVLKKWQESGTGKHSDGSKRLLKIRDIWELTSAPIQCNNTINPATNEQPCWICGEGIPNKAKKIAAGLAAQCEHILPIAQGVMLWSLYGPCDKTKCVADAEYKNYLKMEYDWAHTVCNQVKSSMILLSLSADRKGVEVDKSKIDTLLESIYNSTRKDSAALRVILKKKYKTPADFIKARSDQMKVNKLQPIVNFLNAKFKEFGDKMISLTAYAAAVGRIDPSLDKIWNEYNIHTPEDISNLIDRESPIVIPFGPEEQARASPDEDFTYELTDEDKEAANILASFKNFKAGRRRRTYRRTRRLTNDFLQSVRHQSIKMSSKRHSLSGKPFKR